MGAIFGAFKMGLSAFHKTSTKNELNQEIQVLHRRLLNELEMSSINSVSTHPSTDPDTISFLSAIDSNGNFQIDPRGRPEWEEYVIYYHNSSDNKVYRTTQRVAPDGPPGPAAPETLVPTPIQFYNDPVEGVNPLSFYATGGIKVADNVSEFLVEVRPAPSSEVSWTVTVQRIRYGLDSSTPETLTGTASAFLRN